MQYDDYIENVTQLAVELANTGTLDQGGELVASFFTQHDITPPPGGDFGDLPDLVRTALAQLVDGAAPDAVHHFSRNATPAKRWLGQLIAAKLALVAAGCGNYFVDQSRNRTRRFCSNACASRTTVAAYRARAA